MHRRWIVAAPLALLVVAWLHYSRHGAAAWSAHASEEVSATERVVSSPPALEDEAQVDERPPPAPPAPRRASANAPAIAPSDVPAASGPAETAPPTEPVALVPPDDAPQGGDVQAGIDAVASVDYATAAERFERACSHGSAFACGALGKLLATGTGLPRDVPRGRTYLTRGCTATETWACNHLAAIDHAAPAR